jgi:hypothetical protein
MSDLQSFITVAHADERGRVSITVPFDPKTTWGAKRRYHVRGTLNGHPFEGSLGVRDGRVFFPLAKALREAAGIEPGQTIETTMQPTNNRSETIPPELIEALSADTAAKAFFDGLSAFYRRQHAEWVSGAKQAATRQRRANKVIELLRQRHQSR